jgi:hypothetical protein
MGLPWQCSFHTLGLFARVSDQGRYLQLVEKKSTVVKGAH